MQNCISKSSVLIVYQFEILIFLCKKNIKLLISSFPRTNYELQTKRKKGCSIIKHQSIYLDQRQSHISSVSAVGISTFVYINIRSNSFYRYQFYHQSKTIFLNTTKQNIVTDISSNSCASVTEMNSSWNYDITIPV